MKKLRLDLHALQVETFGTGAALAGGTVNAYFDQQIAPATRPVILTDPETDPSRADSCYRNTCWETCNWAQ
jgi:hypothetical protein